MVGRPADVSFARRLLSQSRDFPINCKNFARREPRKVTRADQTDETGVFSTRKFQLALRRLPENLIRCPGSLPEKLRKSFIRLYLAGYRGTERA